MKFFIFLILTMQIFSEEAISQLSEIEDFSPSISSTNVIVDEAKEKAITSEELWLAAVAT